MSKRINVNPDHYKMKGRERPGRDLAKRPAAERILDQAEQERWSRKRDKERNARTK
jgi:hypothetical protein